MSTTNGTAPASSDLVQRIGTLESIVKRQGDAISSLESKLASMPESDGKTADIQISGVTDTGGFIASLLTQYFGSEVAAWSSAEIEKKNREVSGTTSTSIDTPASGVRPGPATN